MLKIDLTGRRAVVTGGSRGVGRAVAMMLARAGAAVGIGYRSRREEAEAAIEEIRSEGVEAWAEAGDLVEPGAAEALVERARSEFGGLDLLVANAGIWDPEYAPVGSLEPERWARTVSVNLDSVFHLTRSAVPVLEEGGRVVLVGSTAGQRGEAGHADYAATKGALAAFAKSISIELAPRDITVNCVAPGWIDTEMCAAPYADGGRRRIEAGIPLGRVATPEDIAGPIVFLCSPLARHVTGEILNVNGGAVLCG